MDKDQAMLLVRMRHNAQVSNKNWHTYPPVEEKLHTLEITQATVDKNSTVALSRAGYACWCEPDVETYSDQGGGTLIIHRQVSWQ